MSIELQPKARFQENEEIVRTWRAIVDNKAFSDGVLYAMAEYTTQCSPTTEELQGARRFLRVLLNMAEVEKPQPQMPSKRISVIPDTRAKTFDQSKPSNIHPTE